MSLTCINVPDTVSVALGPIVKAMTPAQLIAQFPGNTKTPTANFSAHYRGHTLSFAKNVPFVTTPDLLTFLAAQSAPIV